jgi:hypothetical protein
LFPTEEIIVRDECEKKLMTCTEALAMEISHKIDAKEMIIEIDK